MMSGGIYENLVEGEGLNDHVFLLLGKHNRRTPSTLYERDSEERMRFFGTYLT